MYLNIYIYIEREIEIYTHTHYKTALSSFSIYVTQDLQLYA